VRRLQRKTLSVMAAKQRGIQPKAAFLFWGHKIKPWVSGSYVVDDVVFHCHLFSFLIDVDDFV